MTVSSKLAYTILAVSVISAGASVSAVTISWMNTENANAQAIKNNKDNSAIFESVKDDATEMEELATNKRVANILSYTGNQSFNLQTRKFYIQSLASEIRRDTIDKLAYENLKEYGILNPDLRQTGNDTYTFRDRWTLNITAGSHFYNHPITSVMFINESFPRPNCQADKGFEPYVAFMSTNPSLDIKIITDYNTRTPSYRVTALNKNIPVMDNVSDRVIIDAGCISTPSKATPES